MSYSWNELNTFADIFQKVLPVFKKGTLEDNFSFKYTQKHDTEKYSFSASHTNGKRGTLHFFARETFKNLYNTVLGFNICSKPHVDLTAKITDDLIPLKGSSLSLKICAETSDEHASANFDYSNDRVNGRLGVSIPLPRRLFNLKTDNEPEEGHKKVHGEAVYKLFANKDYYMGIHACLKLPNEGENLTRDYRLVFAHVTQDFEGGVYARHSNQSKDKKNVGTWVNVRSGEIVMGNNFSFDLVNNQYNLESYASFGPKGRRCFFGVNFLPVPTLSFAFEKSVDESTKFTFGYAHVLKNIETKNHAFRFSLDLLH